MRFLLIRKNVLWLAICVHETCVKQKRGDSEASALFGNCLNACVSFVGFLSCVLCGLLKKKESQAYIQERYKHLC